MRPLHLQNYYRTPMYNDFVKRVFIVHRWGGTPNSDWYPWLTQQLQKEKLEVVTPQLPNTDEPILEKWVPALSAAIGKPNQDTFLVGHSMGCQTIARYLEVAPVPIGGAVFVAGYFKRLTGLTIDEQVVADKWLRTPLDLRKVRRNLPASIAIFSDNDPYVPLENKDEFEKQLNSKIVVEQNMHHYTDDNGIIKLPSVLNSLENLLETR